MVARGYRILAAPRRRRGFWGLGQTDGPTIADVSGGSDPLMASEQASAAAAQTAMATGGTVVDPGVVAPPATTWTNVLTNLIGTAGKTAQVALSPLSALPKGTYVAQTPYGTVVSTGGATTATGMNLLTSSQLSNYMPIILIGGAVLIFAMVMGKK